MGVTGLIAIFLAMVAVSVLIMFSLSAKSANADGPFGNPPPANIGNRNVSLSLRIDPPVLLATASGQNDQDVTMLFRLFDANNNQTILYTTYFITVTKGIGQNQPPLLTDFFQAPNGLLAIRIHPNNDPIKINGNQEPYLNAWVADPGGNISVKGPVFLEGGLYRFHVEIFGIDSPRNIFNATGSPKFDIYLSVGDVSTHAFQYNGTTYNSTVLSYYDKVSDFRFDPIDRKVTWSMPFEWDTTLLKSSNAFLHQELRVPKSLMKSTDSSSFNATANGLPLAGRMLGIDPYSYENDLAIHYLLNKFDLASMSEKIPAGTNNITFTLAPVENATVATTTDVTTDIGGIRVVLDWKPSQLSAGNKTTLTLYFSDSAYGGSLNANIRYDLLILDDNSTEVLRKTDLIAVNGTDQQAITFQKNGIYHIQISVKELTRPGQVGDWTRNGTARGVVVVPEFGSSFAVIIAAVSLTGIIALTQYKVFYNKPK